MDKPTAVYLYPYCYVCLSLLSKHYLIIVLYWSTCSSLTPSYCRKRCQTPRSTHVTQPRAPTCPGWRSIGPTGCRSWSATRTSSPPSGPAGYEIELLGLMVHIMEQLIGSWSKSVEEIDLAGLSSSRTDCLTCFFMGHPELVRTYESFSDVGEIRVYFASKILTPCGMHWNAFLIAQIIAKCHSFPNM